ncbi:Uncharacterised protein [Citrobacter amalonaticus]|nr:Uncharacterised protein [Citrobacter amalonaticus]
MITLDPLIAGKAEQRYPVAVSLWRKRQAAIDRLKQAQRVCGFAAVISPPPQVRGSRFPLRHVICPRNMRRYSGLRPGS